MKKYLILLLTMFLCIGLVACSDDDWDDDDIVGNDWRVTGVVRDGGTIIRNNEETYVLVCVDKEGAYFYYDEESQEIYDFVTYPIITESGSWDAFKGINFDDLDGDGNSDVTIYLNDNGTEYEITWIWDANEGYVLADDWSINDDDIVELDNNVAYIGYWEYPDGKILEITEGGYWNLYKDDEFDLLSSGKVQYDENVAFLLNDDGSSGGGRLYFDEDGNLIESENVLIYSELN